MKESDMLEMGILRNTACRYVADKIRETFEIGRVLKNNTCLRTISVHQATVLYLVVSTPAFLAASVPL